jgi:hypothetical protein
MTKPIKFGFKPAEQGKDSKIDDKPPKLPKAQPPNDVVQSPMLTREDDREEEKKMNCLSIQREGKLWT